MEADRMWTAGRYNRAIMEREVRINHFFAAFTALMGAALVAVVAAALILP